ncbi:MAG: M20/M25/M40 family metallo-hydrolase, partial [Oligoflexia bacterium]|nr:M20/M25/M40 family metallo-hydrolase [Oligoflexia bacterium]
MNNKRLIDTFCELVRIPSESPDDREFIIYLEKLFGGLGGKTAVDDFGNLIVRFNAKNSKSREPVLFCAHADTVKPGIGIEPVIDGEFIKSKGDTILGADDKAGIAVIIEMLRTVKKNPPIEVLITRCEEIGTLGVRSVDHNMLKSKKGYVLDSDSIEGVVTGGPTIIHFNVHYQGKSAHAGMAPEKGISAIQAAAYSISKMKLGRIDDETTANVGKIEGGVIRNGIPENTMLLAECRSLNHDKCSGLAHEMKKIFEEGAQKYGARVSIEQETEIRAFMISETLPIVSEVINALKKRNIKPKTYPIT